MLLLNPSHQCGPLNELESVSSEKSNELKKIRRFKKDIALNRKNIHMSPLTGYYRLVA